MMSVEYDDTELQRLFAEMDPKLRLKALKTAFRREANRVRKVAINNLRASLRSDRDLERGIRALVFKRKAAGFRVTVGTKSARKKARKGKQGDKEGPKDLKHILIWAEDGTQPRYAKVKTRVIGRTRKSHFVGRMKRYGFIAKTADAVRNSVTENIHNELRKSVIEVARKHGCT